MNAPLTLVGMTSRWPGGCDSDVVRWQLNMSSGDAMGSVPSKRWELERAVDVSTLSITQQACIQHGGFLYGVQRFDASAFSLSTAEAAAMDPQQRLLLELSYASLHKSSRQRALLLNGDCGVFLGIERPDWALAQPPLARGSIFGGTGDNVSAAAGRVSFSLGLQGPCTSLDLACASGLVALHWARHAVARGEAVPALSLASSLKLVPHGTLAGAGAGMLTVDGRCKTLDSRANGYARGESVGSLVVEQGGETGLLHLDGSAVRQDGRSASLTAPNGLAQRTLLRSALSYSLVAPSELGFVEAHGTGTALGDPTEANALESMHGSVERATPLAVGTVKASVGHSEAPSGQAGLLRVREALNGLVCAGNAQLRALNPLVRDRMHGCSLMLPVHSTGLKLPRSGVSSFGFTGTISHHILSPHGVRRAAPTKLCAHAYSRSSFRWLVQSHPFAQRYSPSLDNTTAIARCPAPHLLHVVNEHVVQSRIIFPGVGYLEMARAAAMRATALNGVFFLQPLALQKFGPLIKCVITDGHFEVRSSEEEEAMADGTVHCAGTLAPMSESWQHVEQASIRACSCARAANTSELYDGFEAIGLQYGPAYRPILQAWSGPGDAMARLRTRTSNQGTQVHPADLDAAPCVGALAGTISSGETRLPFAVDDAQLREMQGELWVVRHLSKAA